MKLFSILTLTCIAILCTALLSTNHRTLRSEQISLYLKTNSIKLLDVSERLNNLAADSSRSLDTLKTVFEETKRTYKILEPFFDYTDPEYVAKYLNGAPLPWIDKKSNYTDIQQPEGIQILDELLFADSSVVRSKYHHILMITERLKNSFVEATSQLQRKKYTDRELLEICRTGTIRIMAMGITGFDRPASETKITDDLAPLYTILVILNTFESQLTDNNLSTEYHQAIQFATTSISLLKEGTNFDSFDRLEFIRVGLNPLYGAILNIHEKLGLEYITEVSQFPASVNPKGRNLFSTDFLNAYKNTGLRAEHVTREQIELGRTLFYDPILSATNDRACASCHQPEKAFTDGNAKSIALGHNGYIDRNAPTLINATFSKRFFYDLRAQRLDDVVEHVLTNKKEFGTNVFSVLGKLRSSPEYLELFVRAFPNETSSPIELHTIGKALSAYLGTLASMNSPVDKYLRSETTNIPDNVRRGFNLFMGRAACATCHFPPTFSGYVPPGYTESESEVLGVPVKSDTTNAVLDPDIGRRKGIKVDDAPIYQNSFKTPTVRNSALTAPYMHNGAYKTLDDVTKFYDLGGGAGIGINHPYQTLAPDRIDFTSKDYADMKAFLEALTDTSGLGKRPTRLPLIPGKLNKRKIGGEY